MIRRIILIAVVGLSGVAVAGDQAARVYAQNQIAQRTAAYFNGNVSTSAHISSFPFVGRLLVSGDINELSASASNATLEQLTLRKLTLRLHGVKLDRAELFKGKVRLVSLKSGTVQVDVDGQSLAQRIGRDVRFHPGKVEVHGRVLGQDVTATGELHVAANVLTFRPTSVEGVPLGAVAALAFSYRLPQSDVFPCAADAEPIEGAVRVSCTVDHIPPRLTGTLN